MFVAVVRRELRKVQHVDADRRRTWPGRDTGGRRLLRGGGFRLPAHHDQCAESELAWCFAASAHALEPSRKISATDGFCLVLR